MKRLLALLLAGGVSTGAFAYGLLLLLKGPEGPSLPVIMFTTLFMLYGATTGALLVRTWVKPNARHGQWALLLASVPAILYVAMVGAHAFTVGFGSSPWGIYIFLGALLLGLILAVQVGCIRFLSAAQQGAPVGRASLREARR